MADEANDSWPFDQPRNVACFTVRQVIEDGAPILYVVHDADDHGWQFLTGDPVSSDDAVIVSMAEIVGIDPSLFEISHLPPGYTATRISIGDEWQILKQVEGQTQD